MSCGGGLQKDTVTEAQGGRALKQAHRAATEQPIEEALKSFFFHSVAKQDLKTEEFKVF